MNLFVTFLRPNHYTDFVFVGNGIDRNLELRGKYYNLVCETKFSNLKSKHLLFL